MGKYRDSLVVGNPMSGKELNLKNGKSGRLSGNGSGIIQKERRKHVHSLSQIPRLPNGDYESGWIWMGHKNYGACGWAGHPCRTRGARDNNDTPAHIIGMRKVK